MKFEELKKVDLNTLSTKELEEALNLIDTKKSATIKDYDMLKFEIEDSLDTKQEAILLKLKKSVKHLKALDIIENITDYINKYIPKVYIPKGEITNILIDVIKGHVSLTKKVTPESYDRIVCDNCRIIQSEKDRWYNVGDNIIICHTCKETYYLEARVEECEHCSRTLNVLNLPNPYNEDIDGELIYENICPECYQQCCDDI